MNQRIQNKNQAFRFRRFARKAYSAFNSMRRVVNIGVVSACMLTFANVSETSAQSAVASVKKEAATEKELDTVTVTASRIEVSLNRAAKLVTVITRDEINRAPVQSIQDLLNYSAGIDVLQRGGHGVQADITIRGGSFDQTAILLNGVNLSNPQTGHYSFDIPINLSDIERVEIIHGPSSIIYGASAFSGGINIITRSNAETKFYGKVQTGSHSLFAAETGGSLKTGILTNNLSAGYNRSDGYIQNSDYEMLNLLWRSKAEIENSKIDIQLGYNDKKYGANTFYSASYPNQYEDISSYFMSIRGETGQKLKFKPLIYWNRHDDCFQLFRDGTPNIPDWYKSHNYHQTNVYGSNLNLQYTTLYGITTLGAEFRNENIISNVLGKPMDAPDGKFTVSDSRTNISYALEHNLILDNLSVTVGVLANYNTALKNGYHFYPSINAGYNLTKDMRIYGTWAKATRMPTFTDLYYDTNTHIGNINLKPDNSQTFELGFKYSNQIIKAYLTGYIMDGKNLISWIKENPDDRWEAHNLTSIKKQGIEVGTKIYFNKVFPIFENTTLDLGYARLNQTKESGSLISYTLDYLRDKFTARLMHPIYRGIGASWNFRWQKRMGSYLKYEDLKPTTQQPYPVFSTLDLQLYWKIDTNWKVNLSMNNLFDKKYFDLGNIPQARFWMIGGISYTL